MSIGFGDRLFASDSGPERNLWLGRAVESGASWVRINVVWSKIAPEQRPEAFEATNPASPAYRWEDVDAAVRDASAHHLKILLTVSKAPTWVEEPGRPAGVPAGAWKPNPEAFGEFGQALAERYGGSFPDPRSPGSDLPRVSYYDTWNEANLENYLAPQKTSSGQLVGPLIYRKMLNSFYAGVKTSAPDATVLGGSFAPFGAPTAERTPPVLFLRNLFCLQGNALKSVPCPEKAHLDALSTHPIPIGPPTESALSPLDVSTPDLGRTTAVVRAAEKARTVRSDGRIGLWVTEFWLDSSPPDPRGIPVAKQARWYEQCLFEYWRAGTEVAIELQMRDEPPGRRGYAETLQSGVYFLDGKPKPSQVAMHFPFVAHRASGGGASVWGIAPATGTVHIEQFQGGAWMTIASVHARGPGLPFTAEVKAAPATLLRASLGSEASLSWKLG